MTPDSGNGRVTLAVLGNKMDTVIENLSTLTQAVSTDHDRLIAAEKDIEANVKDIDDLGNKVRRLDTKRSWEARFEALAAGAIAIYAAINTQ